MQATMGKLKFHELWLVDPSPPTKHKKLGHWPIW